MARIYIYLPIDLIHFVSSSVSHGQVFSPLGFSSHFLLRKGTRREFVPINPVAKFLSPIRILTPFPSSPIPCFLFFFGKLFAQMKRKKNFSFSVMYFEVRIDRYTVLRKRIKLRRKLLFCVKFQRLGKFDVLYLAREFGALMKPE